MGLIGQLIYQGAQAEVSGYIRRLISKAYDISDVFMNFFTVPRVRGIPL